MNILECGQFNMNILECGQFNMNILTKFQLEKCGQFNMNILTELQLEKCENCLYFIAILELKKIGHHNINAVSTVLLKTIIDELKSK